MMSTQRALRCAPLLVGAALVVGCHAHGGQISTTDHGVKVSFSRQMLSPSTVQLTIANTSAQPVCLNSASFDPASFAVKSDKGDMTPTIAHASEAPGCDVLAPGAQKTQSVNAGQGFSRAEIQTGRMCYLYAFSGSPADANAWKASGQICE
jgi:hypothetical protein